MIELRNRPIRATVVDQRLWVERDADLEALMRAVHLGYNTALLADPGAGASSLLNRLAADLEDRQVLVAKTSARRHDSAADLLHEVAQHLELFDDSPRPLRKSIQGDAVDEAYQRLLSAVPRAGRTVVIVDDLPGALGHTVFGRLRDELWHLEVQWVVTARADEAGSLLLPPADAFFEFVHYLTPMSIVQVQELLARRDPGNSLAASVRAAIAERCNGNPSTALRLAREALEAPDPAAAVERGTVVDQVADRLGRPAARLADELARSGSASPSDSDLLRRLGWSKPRAYQVFSQLEESGFVTSSEERTGRPGRPRKTYRLRTPA
jgi:hypothetical protein